VLLVVPQMDLGSWAMSPVSGAMLRPTRQWACVMALAAAGVCSISVARQSALNREVALEQAAAVLAATSLELLPGHTPDYNDEEDSDDEAHFNYGEDSTLGSGGRAKLALHMIPTDLYPDSLCNDGSAAGFYYRKGGSDDSGFLIEDPQWLVFLEGGGWCWDQESCAQRTGIYPTLMSSTKWKPTKALTGIFSPDPLSSPLATANKVYVPYCSSGICVCGRMRGGMQASRGLLVNNGAFINYSLLGLPLAGKELDRAGLGWKLPACRIRVCLPGVMTMACFVWQTRGWEMRGPMLQTATATFGARPSSRPSSLSCSGVCMPSRPGLRSSEDVRARWV
jgi:hypothetical protein